MSSGDEELDFGTRVIHGGQRPDPLTGAMMPPIYATSTYVQSSPGVHKGYEYSRTANPTRDALQASICNLEGGAAGFAFSSGLAASATIVDLLDSRLAHHRHARSLRWELPSVRERAQALGGPRGEVRGSHGPRRARSGDYARRRGCMWVETPTNPLLKIVDLAAVAAVAKKRGILCVCDNTFATPYLQRPLEHGFDIVVHSTTKYLNGHSDAIGGAAVIRHGDDALQEKLTYLQNAVGGVPGPFDSFLTLRGIKTLALRMERHCRNALAIAQFLEAHPKVARVIYPGLAKPSASRARAAADERRLRRHCYSASFAAGLRKPSAFSSTVICLRWRRAWGAWKASSSTRVS